MSNYLVGHLNLISILCLYLVLQLVYRPGVSLTCHPLDLLASVPLLASCHDTSSN